MADVEAIARTLEPIAPENTVLTSQILDVALKYLTSHPPHPDLDDAPGRDQEVEHDVRVALASIHIVTAATVVATAGTRTEQVESITKRIHGLSVDSMDCLCRWLLFCTVSPVPHGKSSNNGGRPMDRRRVIWKCFRVLYVMMFYAEQHTLGKCLSSPTFAELLVRIWMEPIGSNGDLFQDAHDPRMKTCPALWVLNRCLQEEEGRTKIAEQLEIQGCTHRLPGSFARRARQMRTTATENAIQPLAAGLYFGILVDTFSLFPRDERVDRGMGRSKYIYECSTALKAIATSMVTEVRADVSTPLMYVLYQLCRGIHAEYPHAVQSWGTLLNADYLSFLGHTLPLLEDNENNTTLGGDVLTFMRQYATYPPFLVPAMQVAKNHPELLTIAIPRSPVLAEAWKEFWATITEGSRIFREVGGKNDLCDNVTVRELPLLPKRRKS